MVVCVVVCVVVCLKSECHQHRRTECGIRQRKKEERAAPHKICHMHSHTHTHIHSSGEHCVVSEAIVGVLLFAVGALIYHKCDPNGLISLFA